MDEEDNGHDFLPAKYAVREALTFFLFCALILGALGWGLHWLVWG